MLAINALVVTWLPPSKELRRCYIDADEGNDCAISLPFKATSWSRKFKSLHPYAFIRGGQCGRYTDKTDADTWSVLSAVEYGLVGVSG